MRAQGIQQCRQCQSKLIVFNSDQLPIRLPLDATERFQPHEEQSSLHFEGCAPPKPQLYNLMSEGLFVPLSMSCPPFLNLAFFSLYFMFLFAFLTLLLRLYSCLCPFSVHMRLCFPIHPSLSLYQYCPSYIILWRCILHGLLKSSSSSTCLCKVFA